MARTLQFPVYPKEMPVKPKNLVWEALFTPKNSHLYVTMQFSLQTRAPFISPQITDLNLEKGEFSHAGEIRN